MVLQVTQFSGFGSGRPITIGPTGSNGSGANITTHTINSADIGVPADNRYVVLFIKGGDATSAFSVSSGSVNGVSTTELLDNNGPDLNSLATHIAKVPTGTSVTISATFSEQVSGSHIMWVVVYGLTTTTAFASVGNWNTSSNSGYSHSINTTAPGVLFSCWNNYNELTSISSWTGIRTTVYDVAIYGNSQRMGLGYTISPSPQTPATVGCTFSTSAAGTHWNTVMLV